MVQYVDQGDPDAWVYDEAASIIADAGFEVVRVDMPGYVDYMDQPMPAIYVNWLVTNGAVITTGFGVPTWDDDAKMRIEGFFPERDVHVVQTLEIWYWGGGVHCVTNDQPYMELTAVSENGLATRRAPPRMYPNPFTRRAQLVFDAPGAGHARLEIFDAAGRRVAWLLDGPVTSGRHEVDWRGRDDQDRSLPSGVYYMRVTFDNEVDTGRAVLLR